MLRAGTWPLNTVGRRGNTTGCQRLRPTWFAGKWPSLPPVAVSLPFWRPRQRRQRFRFSSSLAVTRSSLALLQELVPKMALIGVVANPTFAYTEKETKDVLAAKNRDAQFAPKNGQKPKPSRWPAYTSSAHRKGQKPSPGTG